MYSSESFSNKSAPSLHKSINSSLLIGKFKPNILEELINLSQCLCRSGIKPL